MEANATWDKFRDRAEAQTKGNGADDGPALLLTRASAVTPVPVEWLWPGRIALGKLSIISGDPGLGKSMLSVALASHVTNGATWPVNSEPCPKGSVIMLSAEDDPADTIRPRLDAAGANADDVFFLDMVTDVDYEGTTYQRSFNINADIELLDSTLAETDDCKLITIDPISAYMGPGTDSHKNTDVRALLKPLADIAQKHGVAIVLVSHLNKGGGAAIYRTMGSLAFMAAARAGFIVVRDKEIAAKRLFLPLKNNLGDDRTGYSYEIGTDENGIPRIEWNSELETVTADDVLTPIDQDEQPERAAAAEFLREELKNGPVETNRLQKIARDAGHSWRTIERAKAELGVVAEKRAFDKSWQWFIPGLDFSEDRHTASSQ